MRNFGELGENCFITEDESKMADAPICNKDTQQEQVHTNKNNELGLLLSNICNGVKIYNIKLTSCEKEKAKLFENCFLYRNVLREQIKSCRTSKELTNTTNLYSLVEETLQEYNLYDEYVKYEKKQKQGE